MTGLIIAVALAVILWMLYRGYRREQAEAEEAEALREVERQQWVRRQQETPEERVNRRRRELTEQRLTGKRPVQQSVQPRRPPQPVDFTDPVDNARRARELYDPPSAALFNTSALDGVASDPEPEKPTFDFGGGGGFSGGGAGGSYDSDSSSCSDSGDSGGGDCGGDGGGGGD